MSIEHPEAELRLSKALINLRDCYLRSIGIGMMDVKTKEEEEDSSSHFPERNSNSGIPLAEGKKIDYRRSYSQGKRLLFPASYFSLESLLLLVCLTASLLILPLILPPLPPPPFMLLLLPICILAVLMILAFMPSSNVRDIAYTYV